MQTKNKAGAIAGSLLILGGLGLGIYYYQKNKNKISETEDTTPSPSQESTLNTSSTIDAGNGFSADKKLFSGMRVIKTTKVKNVSGKKVEAVKVESPTGIKHTIPTTGTIKDWLGSSKNVDEYIRGKVSKNISQNTEVKNQKKANIAVGAVKTIKAVKSPIQTIFQVSQSSVKRLLSKNKK